MIYLTRHSSRRDEAFLVEHGVGRIVAPGHSGPAQVEPFAWWAADNGCFSGRWEERSHFDWLERMPRHRCLFAVAPDVYGDAPASLERGLRYAPLIRGMRG